MSQRELFPFTEIYKFQKEGLPLLSGSRECVDIFEIEIGNFLNSLPDTKFNSTDDLVCSRQHVGVERRN